MNGVAFDGIRRPRQTDAVPNHDQPERAEQASLAVLVDEPKLAALPPITGADLDSII
jgi:hypothetical protein